MDVGAASALRGPAADQLNENVGAALVDRPFVARVYLASGGVVDCGPYGFGVVGAQDGRQLGHAVSDRLSRDPPFVVGGGMLDLLPARIEGEHGAGDGAGELAERLRRRAGEHPRFDGARGGLIERDGRLGEPPSHWQAHPSRVQEVEGVRQPACQFCSEAYACRGGRRCDTKRTGHLLAHPLPVQVGGDLGSG
jgi:hypothetical protein